MAQWILSAPPCDILLGYDCLRRRPAMPTSTALHVAPTDNGCVIRLQGRGTMAESPAVNQVVIQTLSAEPNAVVVMDLSECEYLNSTFLGFLVQMYNRFDKDEPKRFLVAASPERRQQLLHAVRIDSLLPSM